MTRLLLLGAVLLLPLAAWAQTLEGPPQGFVGIEAGRYQWVQGDWYECTKKKCVVQMSTASMTPMYVLVNMRWTGIASWETEYRAFRSRTACLQAKDAMEVGINGSNGVDEQFRCVFDPFWTKW